ncbi:MAG: VOC family protein, partial [Mucilaginibacter sp.]
SPGRVVNRGDGIAMIIGLIDEVQARRIFEQLSAGGEVIMPFEKQFWGSIFGQLTDKFGIRWMINCQI